MNLAPCARRWFVGTCTNRTVDVSANMLLLVHGVTENRIYGELKLYGDLGGGGPFHGGVHQDTIRFTTCLPELQMVIIWVGTLTGEVFAGTYEVHSENADVVAQGLELQTGVWACSLVGLAGESGGGQGNTVWVFQDGTKNGPFPVEVFVAQASKGRWPPEALVAQENGTVWQSVREFLEAAETGKLAQN